jgi:cytochrome c oxidase subunit 2
LLFGVTLLLLTLAGCLLFIFKPVWFPLPVTSAAFTWDRHFIWTLWICGFIFLAVHLLLIRTLLRRGQASNAVPPESQWRLEAGWTTATGIVFIALSILGSHGWAQTSTGPAGKEVIEVGAHQFAWNFRYPGPDGIFGRTELKFISDSGGNPFGIDPADPAGKDDITAATLRIPAGRDVYLKLHSRDVIHDFFVRELRTKQDIVPGMEIPLELHVNQPGSYEMACAELCGLGHSQMRSVLTVMPADEYDRWKRQH